MVEPGWLPHWGPANHLDLCRLTLIISCWPPGFPARALHLVEAAGLMCLLLEGQYPCQQAGVLVWPQLVLESAMRESLCVCLIVCAP
jgi:hypothetical protein